MRFELNVQKISRNDIAIIGMAGRLPLARHLGDFWQNLRAGRDCIIEFPDNRVEDLRQYLRFKNMPDGEDELRFKRKGFLSDIDKFDYKFFRMTAREAALLNPAQRIFLQTTYHAIEHAGYSSASLRGSLTGIYLGYTGGTDSYYDLIKEVEPEYAVMAYAGNLSSIIASRVAHLFDLKGPSMLIDTACSSSMVAFNLACQALRNGNCELAIAGGINLSWAPLEENGSGLGILSAESRTHTFDQSADGTVGGEGCIAMLLKPLHKAVRDRDNILAVVRGIGSNQDGASAGITAPNPLAQAQVIDSAWKDAGIPPETVGYIEAHGTGTKLGDPIEIEGITQAFRRYTPRKQFCAVSALKTNIGHLNSVAGIAGITKAVLSLQHREIPASLHFEQPNDKICFEESPVYVNTQLAPWETAPGVPRRCGVSSFGISGTNCHVVLEEAPQRQSKKEKAGTQLFALSAKTEEAMSSLIAAYLEMLTTTDESLEDICYTSTAGRDHHQRRVLLAVDDLEQLRAGLLHLKTIAPAGRTGLFQPGLIADEELRRMATGWLAGEAVDWEKWYAGKQLQRVVLPLYPFEERRCWVTYPEPAEKKEAIAAGRPFEQAQIKPMPNRTQENAEIRDMINLQLQVMTDQLKVINEYFGLPKKAPQAAPLPAATPQVTTPQVATPQAAAPPPLTTTVNERQQQYLNDLFTRFNKRTATSKALTQQHRQHYANNRHVAGYNKTYKEITYPILVDRAAGSEMVDVDGNQYVDFCMGFGVYLLGYSHPKIMDAIREQAGKGSYLGPMSPLAGEVAALIAELTGTERVAFYNSGTEAVMLALRLARAYTSRTKIVIFSGSYHGTYDGVLGQPDRFSKAFKAVPKATGIPQSILDEVILLDYGTPESLEVIRRHAGELAGVLVEPVQRRRPEFQPKEYLS